MITGFEPIGRMLNSAPRHIGYVQKSVNAADIDKSAVFREIFYRAIDNVTEADVESVSAFWAFTTSSVMILRDRTMLFRLRLNLIIFASISWPI